MQKNDFITSASKFMTSQPSQKTVALQYTYPISQEVKAIMQ